jgi:hypothetical protein
VVAGVHVTEDEAETEMCKLLNISFVVAGVHVTWRGHAPTPKSVFLLTEYQSRMSFTGLRTKALFRGSVK